MSTDAPGPLSKAQLEQFRDDGYLFIPGFYGEVGPAGLSFGAVKILVPRF